MPPELLDAADLHRWVEREEREAQAKLPWIVRRLLAATPGVSGLVMPAGDEVRRPGFDGELESAEAWPIVPAGPSVWEIGTGARPRDKANADYRKRKGELGSRAAQVIFVFVTPRKWEDADTWAADKRQQGDFLDVRVVDSSGLETWLQEHPALHIAISEELGSQPSDAMGVDRWCDEWESATDPRLPLQLVLRGREAQQAELLARLDAGGRPVTVSARSEAEALAFIAAALRPPADEPAPAVVVHTRAAWDRIVAARTPATLIPQFDGAPLGAVINRGFRVVSAAGGLAPRDSIELPDLSPVGAGNALLQAGIGDEVDRYAQMAVQNLSALRRRLSLGPGVEPEWVEQAGELLRWLPLVGAASMTHDADWDVVEQITGHSRSDVESVLRRWSRAGDAPVRLVAGVWTCMAMEDTLQLAGDLLAREDPERWAGATLAAVRAADGDAPLVSPAQLDGLLEGGRLMASFDHRLHEAGRLAPWAQRVGTELMADFAQGELWLRRSPFLSALAEMAPEAFLAALEADLAEVEPAAMALFAHSGAATWPFGRREQQHELLWALESLAWSAAYLTQVTVLLGRLAARDPGGRMANRPINSLAEIHVTWVAHTTAPVQERLAALDRLAETEGEVAWELVVRLLPKVHPVAAPPAKPHFRRESPGAPWTETEMRALDASLVERLIDWAEQRPDRWSSIVHHYNASWGSNQRQLIRERLQALLDQGLEQEASDSIADALAELVQHHRRFADASWRLDDEEISALEQLRDKYRPPDELTGAVEWFSWTARAPVDSEAGSSSEWLATQRDRVAAELYDRFGLEVFERLVVRAETPILVGRALASVAVSDHDQEQLMQSIDTPSTALAHVSAGYLRARILAGHTEWAAGWVRRLAAERPPAALLVLLELPADPSTWALAEEVGETLATAYWERVATFRALDGHAVDFARRLLGHHRPWDALEVLSMVADRPDLPDAAGETGLDALRACLRSDPAGTPAGDASYRVGQVMDLLERSGVADLDIAQVELGFVDTLALDRPPRALTRVVLDDASLWADMVAAAYGPDPLSEDVPPARSNEQDGEETPRAAEDVLKAVRARQVLRAIRRLPGQRLDGSVYEPALARWTSQATDALAAMGCRDIGFDQLGHLLSASPVDPDGGWPLVAVRDFLDRQRNDLLDEGFVIGRMNDRGITMRGAFSGGSLEAAEAAVYDEWARVARGRHPHTAQLLRRIADRYRQQGDDHDDEALARRLS